MQWYVFENWTLPVAITAGALAYFAYSNCPYLQFTKPYAMPVVSIVQPLLIFSMLFLSFCKINVCDLRPKCRICGCCSYK